MRSLALAPITLSLLVCLIDPRASAETQLMSDEGALKLAKMLNGRTLMCGPAQPTSQEGGFFPLSITATRGVENRVSLAVRTAKASVCFGYHGQFFLPVDHSNLFVVIACGNDGYRFLQFESAGSLESYCDEESLDLGVVKGDGPGLLYTVRNGTILETEGLQCCIKRETVH